MRLPSDSQSDEVEHESPICESHAASHGTSIAAIKNRITAIKYTANRSCATPTSRSVLCKPRVSLAETWHHRLVRAVVQRVTRARVIVDGVEVGAIDRGLCVLVGAADGDGDADAAYVADKVANLRIFADEHGKMNLSSLDAGAAVLVVSQFTLLGDGRRGRRPSFVHALEPQRAEELCELVVSRLRRAGIEQVATGRFRTDMQVELVNDGPVTILLDSRKLF